MQLGKSKTIELLNILYVFNASFQVQVKANDDDNCGSPTFQQTKDQRRNIVICIIAHSCCILPRISKFFFLLYNSNTTMPLIDQAVDANNIGNVSMTSHRVVQKLNSKCTIYLHVFFPLFQLKDILLTYNRITEACFRTCAATFNYKTLTKSEVCIKVV